MKRIFADIFGFNKASTNGLYVDGDWPWVDLIGIIRPDPLGADAPTLTAFRTTRAFAYSAGDKKDSDFHVPHTWVPNCNARIHTHWGHNGTAISGNLVITHVAIYADRDGVFTAPITITQTIPCSIGTQPQYCHRVDEVDLTTAGGSASTFDSALVEVDGIFVISTTITTIPTITGGSPNEPFIFTTDIHHQSRGVGTKNNAAPFYG
jgi:hypothetical protein